MQDSEMAHGEIIIVKRGGGDHDEHHGGVWKIAFADFMTAMMAFFLVMWLINASNEETKKAVASYFNPIKLTDRVSNPKGVQNPKYGKPNTEDLIVEENTVISSGEVLKPSTKTSSTKPQEEAALFVDPYAVLSQIAGGVSYDANKGEAKIGPVGSDSEKMGILGGESFQDPFDPKSWNIEFGIGKGPSLDQEKLGPDEELDHEKSNDTETADSTMDKGEDTKKAETDPNSKNDMAAEPKEPPVMNEDGTSEATKITETMGKNKPEEPTVSDKMEAVEEEHEKLEEKEIQLAEEIKEEIKSSLNEGDLTGLDISIEEADGGAVVSIMDASKSGMFNIGSARPRPELIRLVGKVAAVLAAKQGMITVSGHTDARKFKSGDYDNWRLSTARAHMARYMLIRGGLDETRIERIEGLADTKPLLSNDPNAAGNRRIEIFLRTS